MEHVLDRLLAKALSMPYQQVFEPPVNPCFSGFFSRRLQKTGGDPKF
jgi:hypothetical protein